MKGYVSTTYGERIADIYDDRTLAPANVDEVVETLAALSTDGRALELGVGTGRVAIPLAGKGIDVHGIDVSEAMVARMPEKPGGDAVNATIGDMADVAVGGTFSLVFVVFNTFFMLTTQEDQLRCFRNVAVHLTDDGVFVLEVFAPDLSRFARGQNTQTGEVTADTATLEMSRHDSVAQMIHGQHVFLSEDGVRMYPWEMRYAWPSEMDLMAGLAGLRLRDRWSDWDRSPFTSASNKHISVYEKGGRGHAI